ncbi:hypothetical protein HPB50_002657 [Hyalomma asiaticum]|uniref:Uncharacterized protein n=1 Tax=Hyalomma asiaticum TaxID=266040 RepID=A0ACB7RYC7_HYAAI|nr:hypothetical protein HPB50_002657 [Hyalomma asiaticum]
MQKANRNYDPIESGYHHHYHNHHYYYDNQEDAFLKKVSKDTLFLFGLTWPSYPVEPDALIPSLSTLIFAAEARKLYDNMMCRGFGVFLDDTVTITTPGVKLVLKEIYNSLLSAEYPLDEITNFAMYPRSFEMKPQDRDYILGLRPYLGLLVFMPFRQDSRNRVVECIASWNDAGFINRDQASFGYIDLVLLWLSSHVSVPLKASSSNVAVLYAAKHSLPTPWSGRRSLAYEDFLEP